jgi:muramoyltetrapeptide carboxypeptidase
MPTSPNNIVRILRPSSVESEDLLTARLKHLSSAGLEFDCQLPTAVPAWPYTAGSIKERSDLLNAALLDPAVRAIFCARGGYGASDLLPLIPWQKLSQSRPKLLVGFSDATAFHSAFYAKCGWTGLHAPMPATVLWPEAEPSRDVEQTLAIVKAFIAGSGRIKGSIPVQRFGTADSTPIQGKLFGGCLSVVTNLIGTPYFPRSLGNHVLFFEDTGENPGRIMRFFNQLQQANALTGVKAIILGKFRQLGGGFDENPQQLYREFHERSGLPIFSSDCFGHFNPNFPLLVGSEATVTSDTLTWQYILEDADVS